MNSDSILYGAQLRLLAGRRLHHCSWSEQWAYRKLMHARYRVCLGGVQ
jgi:hypothetical protein